MTSEQHLEEARGLLSRATYAGEVNETHVTEIADALAAERAEGAREMRERAAAVCHEVSIAWSERGEHEIADALDDAGNGISDLPLELVKP